MFLFHFGDDTNIAAERGKNVFSSFCVRRRALLPAESNRKILFLKLSVNDLERIERTLCKFQKKISFFQFADDWPQHSRAEQKYVFNTFFYAAMWQGPCKVKKQNGFLLKLSGNSLKCV